MRDLAMLFALVPALTFFGHWPAFSLAMPGTDLYIGVPAEAHAGHGHSHEASDTNGHEAHCHAGLATCIGSSPLGETPVAMLAGVLAMLGAAAAWTRSTRNSPASLVARFITCEPPPPRLLA